LFLADCIDGTKNLWQDMQYKHYPNESLNQTITYANYTIEKTATDQTSTYAWCNGTNMDTADLDCIIFQNRQKYLIWWTQKTWSHLPGAMSYITNGFATAADSDGNDLAGNDRWEYQVACELDRDTSWEYGGSDSSSAEWISLAAISYPDWRRWGSAPRLSGATTCSFQSTTATGYRGGDTAARFVIRP
jgi:hypothetical protein